MRSLTWLTFTLVAVGSYLTAAWLAAGGNPAPLVTLSILFMGAVAVDDHRRGT